MKFRSLLLISICLILVPLLIQPVPLVSMDKETPNHSISSDIANPVKSSPLPLNSPLLPSPDYLGIGAARQTHEIANRTDGNQNILLFYDSSSQTPNGDSASVVLPPSWTGYQLDFSISDLYENRTWALNPSFNGGSTSWTSGYNDLGGSNTFAQTWQAGGPDGNGYVRVQEDGRWDGAYYRLSLIHI